jgi:2,4-dienoyl-CoA reductase-like NADH-dependent reductase (Old Yellow Enzyme family)
MSAVKPTPSDGYDVKRANPADVEAIFQPLRIGRLRIKNRLIRSSISGRIDNYDGSGSRARVNFEERFARGGVGAIISSHAPVASSARVLPNYAMIDCDERIPFWRTVGDRVRHHGCAFILQLSHSGRQQDIAGVENWNTLPLGASARINDSMDLQHERCQLLTSTRSLSCSLGPRNALPPRRWTESSFIPPTAICLLNS